MSIGEPQNKSFCIISQRGMTIWVNKNKTWGLGQNQSAMMKEIKKPKSLFFSILKHWNTLCVPVQDPAAVRGFRRPLQGVQRPQSSPGRPDWEVHRHRNFHRRGQGWQRQQPQRWPCPRPGSSCHPQTDWEEGDEEEGHTFLLSSQWCASSILMFASSSQAVLCLCLSYPPFISLSSYSIQFLWCSQFKTQRTKIKSAIQ